MTYELAKQLKDAGFVFYQKRIALGRNQKVYKKSDTDILSSDFEYVPHLEELIEACGDGFKGLLPPSFPLAQSSGEWLAVKEIGFIEPMEQNSTPELKASYNGWHVWGGNTPEEAVAYLWLEINKK